MRRVRYGGKVVFGVICCGWRHGHGGEHGDVQARPGQRKRGAVAKREGARSAGHALQEHHVCIIFALAQIFMSKFFTSKIDTLPVAKT